MSEQDKPIRKTWVMLKRGKRTKQIAFTANILPIFSDGDCVYQTNIATKEGFKLRYTTNGINTVTSKSVGLTSNYTPISRACDRNGSTRCLTDYNRWAICIDMPEGVYINPKQVNVTINSCSKAATCTLYGVNQSNKSITLASNNHKSTGKNFTVSKNEWYKSLWFVLTDGTTITGGSNKGSKDGAFVYEITIPSGSLYVEAGSPYNFDFDEKGTITYLD